MGAKTPSKLNTERTGHSNSTIRRNLVKLREDGQIVFEGSPRNGYWRLA
ncbi:MAG: hypothetical protein U9N87_00050 [Planctomycetota bacterium]|nr:hypothetical protein [Planctomycetota bacterium]